MSVRESRFNETSEYLKFVLRDMQQQQDMKPGLSQQAWQGVSQCYELEITRLVTELATTLKDKLNPPKFSFFGGNTDTRPLKWQDMHQALLEALEKKNYDAFHNKWKQWEETHSADETDINLGVYFGFIDESLLLYAQAIKKCQQNGYDWVEAYPDVPVLDNNYSDRLTQLRHDKDENIRGLSK